MVAYDDFEAFPFRDMISLEFFFGRVTAVIAEKVIGVKDVENASATAWTIFDNTIGEHIVTDAWQKWRLGE